jgi:hypothetical protein
VNRVVIPAAAVRLDPAGPFGGAAAGEVDVDVTVRIDVGKLPNDTYVGRLLPAGGGAAAGAGAGTGGGTGAGTARGVELRIAIDELGDPTP